MEIVHPVRTGLWSPGSRRNDSAPQHPDFRSGTNRSFIIYNKVHLTSTQSKEVIKWKSKAEEYKELYEKLLDKHEAKTEKLGETNERLKAAEEDLKEALDDNTPLSENPDFNKELKMLIARCNNEKYNKAESMSKFSAKWNVSLKEVIDESDELKIIDFKWKEINNE